MTNHSGWVSMIGFSSPKRYEWLVSNPMQSNDNSNCKICYRYQKKYNYVIVTEKESNAVTSKVTKKITCNCNFITNNELLLFFAFM